MKFSWWTLLYVLAIAVAVYFVVMSIHARAQELTPMDVTVEWRIRAYVATPEGHPLVDSDYTLAKFKRAADCLAALVKPDKKLRETRAQFEAIVRAKVDKNVLVDWTCAPAFVRANAV